MQTTTSPYEPDGGYAAKRGHVPMLSISDDSHHVTETIGHLYGENYNRDVRRLSFLPTPQGETLSVSIPNTGTANMDPQQRRTGGGTAAESSTLNPAASKRPTVTKQPSFDKESSSPVHLSPTDSAANSSFPLNDIDYESNPDAIKQEYHTLAAIRRMSMDVAGDPDLPSYNNFQVPTVAPSASADEDDASRLFWVPARLHPELAPKEFRSFLESRKEQIQRRSGDYSSSLGVEREESKGGLRRKRSKLSKQIDDSQEYVDGADFLGGKKANAHDGKGESSSPNLRELEGIVNDQKQVNPETLALLGGIEKLDLSTTEDKPILPAAPPGHSLKRSTRTQYRKGSLKRGERPPYSRRLGRTPETLADSPSGSLENPPPIKPLMRASTDPGRSLAERNAEEVHKPVTSPTTAGTASQSSKSTALPPGSTTNATFESMLDPQAPNSSQRQWQSRHGSNGRSTLQIPPAEQTIPQIIETPPPSSASSSEFNRQLQTGANVERTTQNESQSAPNSVYNKRQPPPRQAAASQTLSDIASHPSPLPGSNTRTDSLSVIPTLVEEKRSDSKKSKDKKDSDGSRKSSWPWSRGSDDKDKKRDSESRKSKKQQGSAEKAIDKQDNTRLDVLQTSIDSIPRGRKSLILERPIDQRLEEERRKESQRKSSDSKKDKESGLLSSIFGGGKKRSGSDHKKSLSRTLSPEPTYVQLIPDQDYPWTRFTIMEERAIYRMAHIKLANPRRPLHSQVLLSNFMYSYLSKVQKMHPQMVIPTSPAQRAQQQASQQQPQPQQQTDQPDEYTQYQRYQEQYAEQTYDDYNYSSEEQGDHYASDQHGYENGTNYETSQHGHYDGSYGSLGDAAQLESDEEMW